jgi:hypothetical protein
MTNQLVDSVFIILLSNQDYFNSRIKDISSVVHNIIVNILYLVIDCFNTSSKSIPNIITNITKLAIRTITILDII